MFSGKNRCAKRRFSSVSVSQHSKLWVKNRKQLCCVQKCSSQSHNGKRKTEIDANTGTISEMLKATFKTNINITVYT